MRSSVSARRVEAASRSSCATRARKRRDLVGELLGPLGGGRLQRERPQALAHLLLDVASALDLRRDTRELQLGAVPAALELAEAGGFLDQRAPLRRRLRASISSTLPWLTIECIEPPRPTSASSSTRSVRRTGARLTRYWPSPPRTSRRAIGDLRVVGRPPKRAVLVVEDELDLAVLGRLALAAAREEDVVGLLRPQLARRQAAGRPDDRVGDVRLAGAVRADDDGDARLEPDLDGSGNDLKPRS